MDLRKEVNDLVSEFGIVSPTEGIETTEQFRALVEMGCKLFQGFHFAKPMTVDEFEKYCERNTTA